MTIYQEIIKKELTKIGRIEVDPRYIEAFMRLEHDTLNGLSKKQFNEEVFTCLGCVDASSHMSNELLAKSYNL